jgi:hypothetical protein
MGVGRERIPRKTLKFFGEARCAVLCLLCCCTLVRLPCRCRTVPSTIDINIDAGTDQSVIRATLLRYTLKSLPVNVLVCGKLSGAVEDLPPSRPFDCTPDKGFSCTFVEPGLPWAQNFHSSGIPVHSRPKPWKPCPRVRSIFPSGPLGLACLRSALQPLNELQSHAARGWRTTPNKF